MVKRSAFGFAILSLLACSSSSPQETIYDLEGIVVTATRTAERLREIPWGVRIISYQDIETRGAEDLGELLRGEAGIDIRSYGPLGQTATVSLRGSTANQVLVLVDGRPANHIALGISDLGLLSLEGVERVEIVKGPISSLYGANALGGVVNIITKGTPERASVKQEVSSGSFDTEVFEAEAGLRMRKLGLLFCGSSKATHGFRSNSDYEGENASAKVCYGEDDSRQLSLSFGFDRRELGIPGPKPAPGESPIYGDSTATSLFDSQKDKDFSSDLSLKLRMIGHLDVEAKFYLDSKDMDFFSVFQGYNPDWTTYRAELRDNYLTTTLGGNLQFTLTPSSDQKVVLGLDARGDRFEGTSELRNTGTGSADATEWSPSSTSYGLWGEVKRKMSRGLTTITSLRYDRSRDYGSFLSPSVGLVFALGDNSLKLSGGRAFRAPTFNDLHWPGAGNLDLRPESGVAGEVRLESSPRSRVFAAASVFRKEIKDLISWAPVGEGGKWQPSNVDHFSETGGEFEIRVNAFSDVTLHARAGLLSAEQRKREIVFYDFITGETRLEEITRVAAYIPKIDGSAGIGYQTGFGTALSGDIRWVGERANYYPNYSQAPAVTMDEKRLPSAILLRGRLSQTIASFAEVFLRGENLLNRDYAEQFGNSIEDRDYPRPGRNIAAGLSLAL